MLSPEKAMVNDMVRVTQRSETTSLKVVPVTGSPTGKIPHESVLGMAAHEKRDESGAGRDESAARGTISAHPGTNPPNERAHRIG